MFDLGGTAIGTTRSGRCGRRFGGRGNGRPLLVVPMLLLPLLLLLFLIWMLALAVVLLLLFIPLLPFRIVVRLVLDFFLLLHPLLLFYVFFDDEFAISVRILNVNVAVYGRRH
eukprot:Pompholyxophrys_punicea_v1_NODE_103_length_3477_cov_5.215371.p8 type:complete len:113 gc:universal NODE_103_length_3477_cov_5.215371:1518-1180(-)